MEEKWKSVKGYEGKYEVSDWGNVRSLNYLGHAGKTKLLKPLKDKGGYLYVHLCKDGKVKGKKIHRLVAEAFLPNPNHLPEVNHKSECPVLNFACVLEWCTAKYNSNYGTRIQRMADSNLKPVDQFDKDGNFIRRWKSAMEASRQLGTHRCHIGECARGKRKTAGGFNWKYAS